MIADVMMTHWKEIEKVLDKYKFTEKDRAKVLDAYKAICWQWSECNASARAFEERLKEIDEGAWNEVSRPMAMVPTVMRYEREQWPDEWSVATL